MRKLVNGLELIKDTNEWIKANNATAKQTHEYMADGTLQDWQQLCSGNLPPSVTAGAFARGNSPDESTRNGKRRMMSKSTLQKRGLQGQIPLLPINKVTGRLYNSLKKRRGPGNLGRQVFDVGPTESAGPSIFVVSPSGTSGKNGKGGMVARGIWAVIEKRFKARQKAFFDFFQKKQARD